MEAPYAESSRQGQAWTCGVKDARQATEGQGRPKTLECIEYCAKAHDYAQQQNMKWDSISPPPCGCWWGLCAVVMLADWSCCAATVGTAYSHPAGARVQWTRGAVESQHTQQ